MTIARFDRKQTKEFLPGSIRMATVQATSEQSLSVAIKRRLPGFTLDISFQVPAGLTVLFGPSGSGKSLTLQAIAGLFPLDTARIALGYRVWHESALGAFLPPQRRRVGYVPQNYALFPHLTVAQQIAFGMTERGRITQQRVAELVNLMQLEGLEHRRPSQLSGGQQQRVALARALAVDPCLLLLDEPFSSLDAAVRETLREELRAFYERVRVPTVLVTHDAQEAQLLADTVVVIQDGRVLQTGSQQAVFRAPRTPAVAALVGMRPCLSGEVIALQPIKSETHFMSAAGGTEQASTTTIIAGIQVAGLELRAYIPPHLMLTTGQRVSLGLRTDEIWISSGKRLPEVPVEALVLAQGVVLRDQPRGPLHLVSVRLTSGLLMDIPVIRREFHELGLFAGSAVTVQIPADAVHVFDPAQG